MNGVANIVGISASELPAPELASATTAFLSENSRQEIFAGQCVIYQELPTLNLNAQQGCDDSCFKHAADRVVAPNNGLVFPPNYLDYFPLGEPVGGPGISVAPERYTSAGGYIPAMQYQAAVDAYAQSQKEQLIAGLNQMTSEQRSQMLAQMPQPSMPLFDFSNVNSPLMNAPLFSPQIAPPVQGNFWDDTWVGAGASGLAQGGLNTVNGVQDGLIGIPNLVPLIYNNTAGNLFDTRMGYIPSPDWSRDAIYVGEPTHGLSKFLTGTGVITVATLGTGTAATAASKSCVVTEGATAFTVTTPVAEGAAFTVTTPVASGAAFTVTTPVASGAAFTVATPTFTGASLLPALPLAGGINTFASNTGNAPGLVHLTSDAGKAGIEASGQIIGRQGIFAVPESVAGESTAMKVLRTGISPNQTANAVQIPESAVGLFQQPIPIGPYSAWKYFGGTYYAPPGAINITTGAFTSSSTYFGPAFSIYGPDAIFYLGGATSGGIYWYASSLDEK